MIWYYIAETRSDTGDMHFKRERFNPPKKLSQKQDVYFYRINRDYFCVYKLEVGAIKVVILSTMSVDSSNRFML